MKRYLTLSKTQLKISSAVCTNLFSVWFLAIFASKDLFQLTGNIIDAIVSLYLAVKSAELAEKL